MSVPKLITSAQFADQLGLKLQTIKKWRVLGIGPEYVRLNGVVYYEGDKVQAWLAANRHQSTAEYPTSNAARSPFVQAAAEA
jgi:hypothetical protein